MHLVVLIAMCGGLFMLFPKAFKFMVGTWLGFAAGTCAWAICALAYPDLCEARVFLGFSGLGVLGGCVVAAKG